MKPTKFDEKYYKNTIEELNKTINELKILSVDKSKLINELEMTLNESRNKIQDLETAVRFNQNKLISYKNKFKQLTSFVSNIDL
jgi:chromosome segregation ATPase